MATGRVPTTANSPLTAKGDLFGYSTTQARVPVGADGETIVADSSTSTGLRYQSNFAAGKNKCLNSDYSIWQRGTSISLPNSFGYTYTADRWVAFSDTGASAVVSRQTFTPGTAPVAGYEGQYFLRYYTANTSVGHILGQRIENVQTFAGQTVTVSFWAKATSALNFTSYCQLVQDFGSGGSSIVATNYTPSPASITTSWQRFTATVAVPSISGKTIGTNSFLNFQIGAAGNNSLDVWGAQIEASNTATAFQTATGTIQGELAACQRYFEVIKNDTVSGVFYSMTAAYCIAKFNVPKREGGTLTMTYPTTLTNGLYEIATAFRTPTALASEATGTDQIGFTATGMSSGTIGKSLRGTFGVQITASAEL